MNDKPSKQRPTEFGSDPKMIVDAAQALLKQRVLPTLSEREKRQTQNAIALLNSALRQMEHGGSLASMDLQALNAFGTSTDESIADLTAKIDQGKISHSPELITYLKERTLLKLKIENPDYWGYRTAVKRWRGS